MKRWSDAYPGTVKVAHPLGHFKDPQQAYAQFDTKVRALLDNIDPGKAHPVLRSSGYSVEKRYWGDIHFAHVAAAEEHHSTHGGEMWYCVGLYGATANEASNDVREWLKAHVSGMGLAEDSVLVQTIKNDGGRLLADEDAPNLYAYVNDQDTAVLLKLAMGGKA